jgi:hypothetical protein
MPRQTIVADIALRQTRLPGTQAGSTRWGWKDARSCHTNGEPRQIRLSATPTMDFSKSRGRTCVMRLPSDLGGVYAPTADRSLKLNLVGTAATIIRRTVDAKDDASLKAGQKTQPGSGLQHIASNRIS